MDVVRDDAELLVITELGFGKRTSPPSTAAEPADWHQDPTANGENGKIIGVKVVHPITN